MNSGTDPEREGTEPASAWRARPGEEPRADPAEISGHKAGARVMDATWVPAPDGFEGETGSHIPEQATGRDFAYYRTHDGFLWHSLEPGYVALPDGSRVYVQHQAAGLAPDLRDRVRAVITAARALQRNFETEDERRVTAALLVEAQALASADVPDEAVEAFDVYRGSADAAWGAGDEQAWAQIRQHGDAIRARRLAERGA